MMPAESRQIRGAVMVTIDKEQIPWQEGMCVLDVMEAIADRFPYAVVRLNGKLVSRPNFDKTPVPDGSVIVPIPMVAGG